MIIEVRHHFDAAHRLPELPGKCQSLHGHTWRVKVGFAAPVDKVTGIAAADFSLVKKDLRTYIDTQFDHATLMGSTDPLYRLLSTTPGNKVTPINPWPTVETVTEYLAAFCERVAAAHGMELMMVKVDEGLSNSAIWTPFE